MPLKDKEARAAYQKAHHLANREKHLKRMSEYAKTPKGKAGRAAYSKNNPEIIKKIVYAFRKRNPEKLKAWWTFNNALRAGKIVKPFSCAKCGSVDRLDGHHPDYSKPLEVVWFCRPCHVEESPR